MEERLKFLASGTKPRKNKEVMNEVIKELKQEGLFYGDKVKVKAENYSTKKEEKDEEKKNEKKDKKDKKRKHSEVDSDESEEEPKKKKRKEK